ncbi:probable polygalacturonase [Vigna unguiculata]|uniref:Galacturan 1 n=1 Tax=Vigna unguiculata TaxID=3917 RepID=A0A4D6MDZ8_VIGUN|nr:probable polygalacturonase [Vigna unguiculata]QCD98256.1 galacturan 1 [Vigna unguiculata]
MQLFLHWIQNFVASLQFQLAAAQAHMKELVAVLFLVAICAAVESNGEDNGGPCKQNALNARPHSVSILEFGAVGDGITLNTVAFQNAIFYLKSFADKGGAQLYVPSGTWLTGSFNLTSHLTLFLERGATIIASQDCSHWDVVDSLPSYGRGIGRYRSLIYGQNLSDVVVTGDNGTIDGQGSVWWELFSSHSLNYSRPNLIEFVDSVDVIISNLTFVDSPAWGIHPVYCSNVQIQNITSRAPAESPYTSGIVPDSSKDVCIENSNISSGHDAIVLKSGWDQYGIAYGKPTSSVQISNVYLQSSSGAGLAFGSEMSGGISDVIAEKLHILNSPIGIELKTTRGRGGYMKGILISDAELENIHLGISMTGYSGFHPDDKYDTSALPVVDSITFKNVMGANIDVAGNFSGIFESPFSTICLSNVTFSLSYELSPSWFCSNVIGFSEEVIPEPCPDLQSSYSKFSFSCFPSLYPHSSSNISGSLDQEL